MISFNNVTVSSSSFSQLFLFVGIFLCSIVVAMFLFVRVYRALFIVYAVQLLIYYDIQMSLMPTNTII